MMRYVQRYDGEQRVINPQKERRKIACCDCGLVHLVEYKVAHRQKLTIIAWRDKRATAQRRRWQKKQASILKEPTNGN